MGHYFRHLYQTVKFIADNGLLKETEKKNYLEVLRSQISNHEQVLLLYSYLGDFGKKWEDENNRYFSNYEMIHNIDETMLIEGLELTSIFANTITDTMFDYKTRFQVDND